jgi:hypothetical protein
MFDFIFGQSSLWSYKIHCGMENLKGLPSSRLDVHVAWSDTFVLSRSTTERMLIGSNREVSPALFGIGRYIGSPYCVGEAWHCPPARMLDNADTTL